MLSPVFVRDVCAWNAASPDTGEVELYAKYAEIRRPDYAAMLAVQSFCLNDDSGFIVLNNSDPRNGLRTRVRCFL